MKKSLLIASALMLAGSAYAETSLYMGETKMEAGKTYTCPVTEYMLGGYCMDPDLSVQSDVDATFTFAYKCTTGQELQFCGPGQCQTFKESSYSGTVEAGKKWRAQLEYIDSRAKDPESVAKDINVELTLDTNSYTLIMNSSEGKVTMIQKDRNVAFSNNALVFNLSGAANATVYDMQGRKVLSTIVSGNGSLDLNTLGRGAYIYRIGNISGKVLVK